MDTQLRNYTDASDPNAGLGSVNLHHVNKKTKKQITDPSARAHQRRLFAQKCIAGLKGGGWIIEPYVTRKHAEGG